MSHGFLSIGRKKYIIRSHLGEVFRELARQKECEVHEGHCMSDHVHMMISIPPKYAVAQIIGYIKGKSAIHMARNYRTEKEFYRSKFLGLDYYNKA